MLIDRTTRLRPFCWDYRHVGTAYPRLAAVIFDVDGRSAAPRPGLTELVASLLDAGIRIAVATTGRRASVEPLVRVRALLGDRTVEVRVMGDHPEVYWRALSALGVSPKNAVAVEDSAAGLRAATAVGMVAVVVKNGYAADQDFTGAALVCSAYDGAEPLRAATLQRVHRDWWTAEHSPPGYAARSTG